MPIVSAEESEKSRERVACGAVVLVLVLIVVVALTPALMPVSCWLGSYKYTLSLGRRIEIPERFNGSPYRDPELLVGRYSYVVRIIPRIGLTN